MGKKCRKENEKSPVFPFFGKHRGFSRFGNQRDGKPVPYNQKRDSLSTVSLVREAGLEAVLCQPACNPSPGKDGCRFGFWRPPDDRLLKKCICNLCESLLVAPRLADTDFLQTFGFYHPYENAVSSSRRNTKHLPYSSICDVVILP